MEDTIKYQLLSPAEAEYREKKSIFIAHASIVVSQEEALSGIEAAKKKFHDARHHPFAWVCETENGRAERCSDDGEPSRSSGPPILARIDGESLVNTLVIVTRYFGGVKLGTGGLVRAYSTAAAMAIEASGKTPFIRKKRLSVKCPFAMIGQVVDAVKKAGGEIVSTGSEAPCLSSGCGNAGPAALIIADVLLQNEGAVRERLSADGRIVVENI